MVRKILLYGDLDLNVIDGSSIWLVNLAKLLLEDKSNYVDILLRSYYGSGFRKYCESASDDRWIERLFVHDHPGNPGDGAGGRIGYRQ